MMKSLRSIPLMGSRTGAAGAALCLLMIPAVVQPAGPPITVTPTRSVAAPAAKPVTPPAVVIPAPPAKPEPKVETKPEPKIPPANPEPSVPVPLPALAPPVACPPFAMLRYTLLRSAQLGTAYKNTLAAGGGRAPHIFSALKCGTVPDGIQADTGGALAGTPAKAGVYRFSVVVQDSSTPPASVLQHYELRVFTPAQPPTAPAKPDSKGGGIDMRAISGDDANRSLQDVRVPKSVSYMLTAKIIEQLLAPPKPAKAEGEGESKGKDKSDDSDAPSADKEGSKADKPEAAEKKDPYLDQRKEVLMKLKDTEYPSRDMFAQALDAGVCFYVNSVAQSIAAAKSTKTVKVEAEVITCPDRDAAAPGHAVTSVVAKAATAGKTPAKATAPGEILLADWPQLILPDRDRENVIQAARNNHYFSQPTSVINWTGLDCGCTHDMDGSQVYGFYPFWLAGPGVAEAAKGEGKADGKDAAPAGAAAPAEKQPIDFSLLTRIGYFAMPFDDDGSLPVSMHWKAAAADFVREARTHRTGLDLVLYRNDWGSLLNDEAKMRQVIDKLPENALREIDTPLTDWRSRLKAMIPLEPAPTMGTGITLYFDGVPEKDQARFADFFNRLMTAMIDKMRSRSNDYALNVVIPFALLNKKNTAYEFRSLVDHLTHAENLEVKNDRIITHLESADTNSNINLNYLILLPEPTTDHKKDLRLMTERPDVPSLKGASRKFFLRNMVPVISYGGADAQQLEDDLIYFGDNFGGVGFWPLPLDKPEPNVGASIYKEISRVFVKAENTGLDKVGRWACPHRWWLRLLLLGLLLVDAVAFSARFLICSGPVQTPQYTWFLWALGLLNALVWLIALGTDPAFSPVVGFLLKPKFLGAVTAVLTVWIYIQAHQKRFRKP